MAGVLIPDQFAADYPNLSCVNDRSVIKNPVGRTSVKAPNITNLIATAWLVSAPFFVLLFIFRKHLVGRLFCPTNRSTQFVFSTVYFGQVVAAAFRISGSGIELASTELIVWLGFAQLLLLWVRGVYLLQHQADESVDQSYAAQHEHGR